MSWDFPIVLVLAICVLLGSSKWAVTEIEYGNFLPAKIVAIGLIGLFVGIYVLIFVLHALKAQRKLDASSLEVVKNDRLACKVCLTHAGNYFCSTEGQLWIEGDQLRFQGKEFDFALRTSDFHKSFNPNQLMRGRAARVLSLKGQSWLGLRVLPIVGGRTQRRAFIETEGVMKAMIDRWRVAPNGNQLSLFPPITTMSARPNLNSNPVRVAIRFTGATLMFGLFGWVTHLLFADYMPDSNPLPMILVFALLPLILLIALWGGVVQSQATRKSIQKLKISGKVEMV